MSVHERGAGGAAARENGPATVSAAAAAAAAGSSHAGVVRVFGLFIGLGYIAYLLLLSGSYAALAGVTATWWTPVALCAVFVPGAGMAVTALLRRTDAVRRWAAVAAAGFVAAAVTWFPAWDGMALAPDFQSWMAAMPGLAGLAAAAAWRPLSAFAYLVVAVLLVTGMDHVVRDAPFTRLLLPDLGFALVFCFIFVAAAAMAFRTGRLLDETIVEAHRSAASAAAAEAERVERKRFDALIHDTVLSTLLAASRGGEGRAVAAAAARTVERFDALRGQDEPDADVAAELAIAHLRTAATESDERVRFTASITDAHAQYPREAVRSMALALGEAVRNSVRHAGAGADRSVSVELAPGRVGVRAVDDGAGFDPASVSRHRLGVAVSIKGRMAQLPGGAARVVSAPGDGTRVELEWTDAAGAASPASSRAGATVGS